MAQSNAQAGPRRAVPGRRRPARQRPRVHAGRLALLVLVLIAAAFYVSPLRAFFAQQDRYQRADAALGDARAQNAGMKRQLELLQTRSYVAQVARSESMMVPPDTQVFVVKGLPGKTEEDAFASPAPQVAHSSLSVIDRLDDLWRTLLH